jgi:sulfur-carrier protein adenylyltransferase/sulfurtransferase
MSEAEISVEKLKERLDAGEKLVVLDVREPWEYEIAHLEKAVLIPLNELPERFKELDPKEPMVVMCHSGGRSARAVGFLRKSGFPKAINLKGGIAAWSERVDPQVPKY